ncbi:MAG: hypothetical protein ASARMPRED_003558 [Alectoria sarmentosa]|nr:MAG: hypothetical protein ASARMPRED_003558 [Alectoria sarmentosa]
MEKQSSKKRKVIDDFFKPISKRPTPDQILLHSQHRHEEKSKQALTLEQTPVPGLALLLNFIEPAEERSILNFLDDPSKCTWRTDLSRRTMHFGGTYCLMPSKSDIPTSAKPEILQAPPMPKELEWLIQRMVDAHVFPDHQRPQYCIVNEYTGNLGISAHTENFQFGEPVVGLSLLSACPIRFREQDWEKGRCGYAGTELVGDEGGEPMEMAARDCEKPEGEKVGVEESKSDF